MRSDSAFYIGTTHEICEDYAVNGDDTIVVSDGCSSSPNTDIGARVVCECMKKYNEKSITMTLANNIINTMYVPKRCLDVTLLTAFEEDNKIIIKTIGDGNIIIKTKDGILHVVSMNYAKSAPYYMSYVGNKEDDLAWDNIPDNDYTIEYTEIEKLEEDDHYLITTNKSPDNKFTTIDFIPNCDFSLSPKQNELSFNKKDIEWVALSSDGLGSFYEKITTETSLINKPVWYIDVIMELLKINNVDGKFVQRRLNKFRKTCAKKNWYNADDISLAILVPGE